MNDDTAFSDVFADGVTIVGGPYGMTLTFLLSDPAQQEQLEAMRIVARVRCSPDMARTLGEALAKVGPQPQAVGADGR